MASRKNLQYREPDTQFEFDESDDDWNSKGSMTTRLSPVPPPTSHPEIKKPSPRKISGGNSNFKVGSSSLPVKVAANSSKIQYYEDDNNIEDEDDGMLHDVPPRQYLAMMRAESLSVQEGVGRTLKGRDQTRVRNDVFKKTGFQD